MEKQLLRSLTVEEWRIMQLVDTIVNLDEEETDDATSLANSFLVELLFMREVCNKALGPLLYFVCRLLSGYQRKFKE